MGIDRDIGAIGINGGTQPRLLLLLVCNGVFNAQGTVMGMVEIFITASTVNC